MKTEVLQVLAGKGMEKISKKRLYQIDNELVDLHFKQKKYRHNKNKREEVEQQIKQRTEESKKIVNDLVKNNYDITISNVTKVPTSQLGRSIARGLFFGFDDEALYLSGRSVFGPIARVKHPITGKTSTISGSKYKVNADGSGKIRDRRTNTRLYS